MQKMAKTKQIHVAMFPWIAYGHFIPFLHLSNNLAKRGHKISFLLPKSAQPKIEKLSQHPNLIHFFPLTIPQLQGLPSGAETASDVPLTLNNLLCTAYDRTRDQVEHLLGTLMPQVVLFDFACWIPSLARKLNFKTIHYSIVSAATVALSLTPSPDGTSEEPSRDEVAEGNADRQCQQHMNGVSNLKPREKPDTTIALSLAPSPDMTLEEPYRNEVTKGKAGKQCQQHLNEDSNLKPRGKPDDLSTDFGSGLSFFERITTSLKESDAIAVRTCVEIEGPFCDYIAKGYKKPVFVTGTVLPETQAPEQLEEKWENWLGKFEEGSLVYCAFGSQITLQKDQFQELLLGFELSGRPFLAALSLPEGCKTVSEALPEGFEERVGERGWVYGGWAPQREILEDPSVGCFVSHCGASSMWESLLSDCQIVLVPYLPDHIANARLLADDLKVAVEVERFGENRWVSKESLSQAIESVMDKTSEVACEMKSNHDNLRNLLSKEGLQEEYVDGFVKNLQDLILCN